MQLPETVLEQLAEMVVGNHGAFPYRSNKEITWFFGRCGCLSIADGSSRAQRTLKALQELNLGPSHAPDLPSDSILRVITELLEDHYFEEKDISIEPAAEHLDKVLQTVDLALYVDKTGRSYVRNTGTGASSSAILLTRPLSHEEVLQRRQVAAFLDTASEDDITAKVLVPLFQRLGFHRVTSTGHTEKILEFGQDLWMKYQIPTGHWIYFSAQIKRGKIDASRRGGSTNAAEVLTQARMAFEHPIFDPDANRRVLLDHLFIIAAGEITHAARLWIVEQLDASQRRQIIFMDRDEFLDHSARILLGLSLDDSYLDRVPFDWKDVPF